MPISLGLEYYEVFSFIQNLNVLTILGGVNENSKQDQQTNLQYTLNSFSISYWVNLANASKIVC